MVEQVFVPVPHFLTDWFRVGMEKLFHKKKKINLNYRDRPE